MTNQANAMSKKSPSPSQEEYDPKKQKWFALSQRWIPRLLGIVPLVVLTSSLMSQGGIQLGIWMYLISFASIFVLLLIFIVVTSIDEKLSNTYQVDIKPKSLNDFSEKAINLFSLRRTALPNDNSHPKIIHSGYHSPTIADDFDPPQANDFRLILTKWLSDFSLSLKEVFLYLLFLRVQVFTALFCALLFQTGQVNDIVLAIILDHDWPAFRLAFVLALLFSLLLWHTSRYLNRSVLQRKKKKRALHSFLFSPTKEMYLLWLAWFSIALFTVPIATQVNGYKNYLLLHIYIILGVQAAVIFCWRRFDRPISTWTKKFYIRFIPLYLIGLSVPLLFQHLKAYEIPELVGSLGVLFWALSTILVLASIIYQFSILTGIPLLSTLIIAAYFVNMNRFNDNHAIRLIKRPDNLSRIEEPLKANFHKLKTLESQFDTWVTMQDTENKSILDIARQKNAKCKIEMNMLKLNQKVEKVDCRYPIYIASAQGGGIYAAYHTAKTFQILTEHIPNFQKHLFAISSVSGGSVGAAIYVNSLRGCNYLDNYQKNKVIDSFFDRPRDPLAVIVASMFFGDLFQRFYPIPINELDRSLGLELAFEPRSQQSIANKFKLLNKKQDLGNDKCINLQQSFYETQGIKGPFNNSNIGVPRVDPVPFLVLNTTEVENGRRYLISPFRMQSEYTDADFHEPWPKAVENVKFRDMYYSTAAGLSARFPLISPYGFFPEQRARRFIDGGLYDNSGAVTASEIFWSLHNYVSTNQHIVNNKKVKNPYLNLFKLKVISILDKNTVDLNSNYSNPEQLAKASQFKFFGWTALTAVFSTRESRTGKAVDIFSSVYNNPYNGSRNNNMDHRVLLEKDFLLAGMARPLFSIPLGWKLSCQARAFINDQLQVDPEKHVFIPCELRGMQDGHLPLNREPVRYRPAHLVNNAIQNDQDDISISIRDIVKRIKTDINPIYSTK
jgi:hypothetical protein